MIEKTVLDYLNGALDVPVYMEMPKTPPTQFVLIEKTGTSRTNQIESAIFAIQSHADTMYNAALLNDTVKAAMLDIATLGEIASCGLNSDYNYTDGTTKTYRYQAVFQIIHY